MTSPSFGHIIIFLGLTGHYLSFCLCLFLYNLFTVPFNLVTSIFVSALSTYFITLVTSRLSQPIYRYYYHFIHSVGKIHRQIYALSPLRFYIIISTSFVHFSIHPSIHLSTHSSIQLSIHPSIHSSIYSSIHLCTFLQPSIHRSIYMSIYPSIHPTIHPFLHPFIHPFDPSIHQIFKNVSRF